jgi:aminocarboxymuconate-semialdehyde decarboxylase
MKPATGAALAVPARRSAANPGIMRPGRSRGVICAEDAMRIDVHAHYLPADYTSCLARLGHPDAGPAIARMPGGAATLDAQLATLDAVGIDRQVLSVGPLQPQLPDAAAATEAASLANDLYAAVCREHGDRFSAFAALPLPHVDAALAEAARALDTLGMLGVTLGCSVAGRPLDDPAFAPLIAELDRRATVLFLHPVGACPDPLMADFGLAWTLGAVVEDSIAAMRLVWSGLTTRYPRLRIVVPHLGGTLPFLVRRLDDAVNAESAGVRARAFDGLPSANLRRLWYDTANGHPAALRCACESFGADRLMLGTDYPYRRGANLEHAVNYVDSSGLAPEEAQAIRGDNAAALLGIPAR